MKKFLFLTLSELFHNAPVMNINSQDRILIFSDLHMGNQGDRDDFLKNSSLFAHILANYYLKNDFKLILNGDIEELHKFSLKKITTKWADIYDLYDQFRKRDALYKTIGNHDYYLLYEPRYIFSELILPALVLDYHDNKIFIFHGQQASNILEKFNPFFGLVLRYITKPLGIKNHSAAYDSRKRFKIEKKVHDFSSGQKIISIIGHTHRPLFESLSKIDTLRFKIEQLCREYPIASNDEKRSIEIQIHNYKEKLQYYFKVNKKDGLRNSIYDSTLLIPCVFNSGCGIGKRGITSIEIKNGKIYLIYWFNIDKNRKHLEQYDQKPRRLGNSSYYRMVLKKESLDYIFSRIKLLA